MSDTRERAVAILSGHKLRMLEAEGIVCVDKQRLDALERLHRAITDGVLAIELLDEARSPELRALHAKEAKLAENDSIAALKTLEAMDE